MYSTHQFTFLVDNSESALYHGECSFFVQVWKHRAAYLKHLIIWCFLCLLLAGCHLGNPTVIVVSVTPAPTKTLSTKPIVTTQPDNAILSGTLNPSGDNTQTSNTPASPTETAPACTPRDNWIKYEIQRGDNLTRIANLTGSTVTELIAANCLENPNAIRAGQTLYVPRNPAAASPSPSPAP